jgi:GAF domain-containing protein
MSSELRDPAADDPLHSAGSEPLVPILRADDGQVDPVALATWHEALSNTVAIEVPHDLMALWLYPAQGGAVLLGPAELAQDELVVPLPAPYLKPEQLALVEEIVLDAGYRSASCLPIRFGKRDVALLMVADLQPKRYGAVERVLLQCVAQQVAPMLGRIARQWKPAEGSNSRQQERIAGLLETVARANRDAATPQRFVAAIGHGLAPLLPHEHIELLLSDAAGKQYFRLGEHPGGPLWSDPSLVISGEHLDVARIFGSRNRLLVGDTYEDDRWPRGFLTAGDTAGDLRALVGARLNLRGGSSAFLLVGSVGPELYEPEDVELLVLLAGLITPQIGGFLRPEEQLPSPAPPPAKPVERDAHAELLFRIAGLLATTSDPVVATRLIAAEARGMLPFNRLAFALRVSSGDGVVLLEPGERRALPNLPLISVAGTALARVLQGELPCAFGQAGGESRMIVPLRVAGRVHGALIFGAKSPDLLTEHHVLPALHLADVVAAHLELLRLTATAATHPVAVDNGRKTMRALPATPPLRVERA